MLDVRRIFLLSPANAAGKRSRMVTNERAMFDLAVALRTSGAQLGDLYSFMSGLYFRGKLTYAKRFANPPEELPGVLVITPCRGLLAPDTILSVEQLREIGGVPIDAADPRYREPLQRDAQSIGKAAGPECQFVLLGSVATAKYVEPLLELYGDRLLFPGDFVGRGDMSRGGLLLRCAESGEELPYIRVADAVLHGRRPPKLPKLPPRAGCA